MNRFWIHEYTFRQRLIRDVWKVTWRKKYLLSTCRSRCFSRTSIGTYWHQWSNIYEKIVKLLKQYSILVKNWNMSMTRLLTVRFNCSSASRKALFRRQVLKNHLISQQIYHNKKLPQCQMRSSSLSTFSNVSLRWKAQHVEYLSFDPDGHS